MGQQLGSKERGVVAEKMNVERIRAGARIKNSEKIAERQTSNIERRMMRSLRSGD